MDYVKHFTGTLVVRTACQAADNMGLRMTHPRRFFFLRILARAYSSTQHGPRLLPHRATCARCGNTALKHVRAAREPRRTAVAALEKRLPAHRARIPYLIPAARRAFRAASHLPYTRRA